MAQPLRTILVAVALAMLGPAIPAGASTKVGVTSAVNPDAAGLMPGLESRILRVGVDNFADERITTGPSGQAQLVFLDGASLSVGPNATVKIDRFVYDSSGRLGTLALSATSGVMRFVGGAISKTSAVEITTPAATLGIRGGIALVDLRPGAPLVATMLYGESLSVTAEGVTQTVLRPGYSVTVAPGQPPSEPGRLTASALRAQLAALQGAKPAATSSGEPLQDATLARSGVSSATGSALAAAQLAASVTIPSKPTATEEQASTEILTHVARLQREGVDYFRFLTIYDYLDRDLLFLPLVNSNRVFATRLLGGYVGGIIDTTLPGGSGFSTAIVPGSLAEIFLDGASHRVDGEFFVSIGDCCYGFGFGGEGRDNRGRSVYLAQNVFAARASLTNQSVFADGSSPAIGLSARAVMVSADALKIDVPGATPCECRFMTWGWWVGSYQQPNGRVDAVNLGSWVVGRLPELFEVPLSGTATYSGQAVGNVVTANGVHYLAGGSYQLSWNFATKSGISTIANFDGLTVQGASSSSNGRDYTGSLTGSARGSSLTGSLAGSFYKGGNDPVLGTGGNFAFSNAAGYRAGGTFIARR